MRTIGGVLKLDPQLWAPASALASASRSSNCRRINVRFTVSNLISDCRSMEAAGEGEDQKMNSKRGKANIYIYIDITTHVTSYLA